MTNLQNQVDDLELNCDTFFCCAFCDEEYELPEDIDACPICLCESLERIG